MIMRGGKNEMIEGGGGFSWEFRFKVRTANVA